MPKKKSNQIKDRIVELRRVKASELLRNPKNWRIHGVEQRTALRGLIDDVGFVGALIGRDTENGIEILDGHLRADIAGDEEVPVLIVDLDDSESEKVLAFHDSMADTDTEALSTLISQIETDNAELMVLIDRLDSSSGLVDAEKSGEPLGEKASVSLPDMELQPFEHYDYIIVLSRNLQDWQYLADRLGIEKVDGGYLPGKQKVGLGRAVDARRLIELLEFGDDK